MQSDYELLKQALDTFTRIRHWVEPDFYREHVMPTVNRIRERVAVIETQSFTRAKPTKAPPPHYEEPDTIPDNLMNAMSGFGIFKEK